MDKWTRIAQMCLVGTTFALTACSGGNASTTSSAMQEKTASPQNSSGSTSQQSSRDKFSAAEASPPPAVDPCKLASAAEVSAIVGNLRSGPTPMKAQTGETLSCNFVTESGNIIAISVIDAVNWDFRKSFHAEKPETVKLSGLGEEAFFEEMDRLPGGTHVLRKPYILEVRAGLASVRRDQEVTQAIAAAAIGRI